ncbi:hypothetical protein ACFL2K_00475 [Candidatus Margulisiibacteriota bacterium]
MFKVKETEKTNVLSANYLGNYSKKGGGEMMRLRNTKKNMINELKRVQQKRKKETNEDLQKTRTERKAKKLQKKRKKVPTFFRRIFKKKTKKQKRRKVQIGKGIEIIKLKKKLTIKEKIPILPKKKLSPRMQEALKQEKIEFVKEGFFHKYILNEKKLTIIKYQSKVFLHVPEWGTINKLNIDDYKELQKEKKELRPFIKLFNALAKVKKKEKYSKLIENMKKKNMKLREAKFYDLGVQVSDIMKNIKAFNILKLTKLLKIISKIEDPGIKDNFGALLKHYEKNIIKELDNSKGPVKTLNCLHLLNYGGVTYQKILHSVKNKLKPLIFKETNFKDPKEIESLIQSFFKKNIPKGLKKAIFEPKLRHYLLSDLRKVTKWLEVKDPDNLKKYKYDRNAINQLILLITIQNHGCIPETFSISPHSNVQHLDSLRIKEFAEKLDNNKDFEDLNIGHLFNEYKGEDKDIMKALFYLKFFKPIGEIKEKQFQNYVSSVERKFINNLLSNPGAYSKEMIGQVISLKLNTAQKKGSYELKSIAKGGNGEVCEIIEKKGPMSVLQKKYFSFIKGGAIKYYKSSTVKTAFPELVVPYFLKNGYKVNDFFTSAGKTSNQKAIKFPNIIMEKLDMPVSGMKEEKAVRYLLSIAIQLKRIIEMKRIYPDLKFQNFMIGKDKLPKLIDLGDCISFEKTLEQSKSKTFQSGTITTMAPETLLYKKFNIKKSMVFSLGVMFIQLIKNPYYGLCHLRNERKNIEGEHIQEHLYLNLYKKSDKKELIKDIKYLVKDKNIQNLLFKMMQFDPKERIDIDYIIKFLFKKITPKKKWVKKK